MEMEKTEGSAGSFNLFGVRLNVRVTVILVASTLLLMLDFYNRFIPADTAQAVIRAKAVERFVYYLVVPLLIVVVVFREKPSAYGFQIGDLREGLKWTGLVILLAAPVLFFSARTPEMAEYYSRVERSPLEVIWTVGLDLFGWEYLFRGFILFGLLQVIGPSAVVVQAVPFALAHLGKPELETMSTIFGGILFGWVAWRGSSFIYPFLIHWFINSFVVLVALTASAQ